MSTCINASATQNPRKSPGKVRRPITLQRLRDKKKPTAWLRTLISPLDFGVKVRTMGLAGKPVSKPVHCNKNAEILDAFRHGDWHRIERLSNPMLDDHWNDRRTYYYTANGSTRNRFVLVNIDIDCHGSGTPEAANEAAEYLKASVLPGLYHEPSTNGRGRHGYFILDKWDSGAQYIKSLLKGLERALHDHLLARGFDIEMCEIKGLPPVVSWGDDDRISNYTAGILAKIPRQVERFDEWKRTTVLNEFGLRKLIATIRTLTPEPSPVEEISARHEAKSSKPSGSIGGKLIGEEELAQLASDGHFQRVAATLMESHLLKTSSRSVVTTEDVAAFLLILKFFTNRMNADGTLPVRRFEALWTGLFEVGDVGRAFDCHRFKAIRDYLSDLGLIDWEDKTYIVPRIDEAGKKQKGRACKWKAGAVLMEMLDWQKQHEGGDESEGSVRDSSAVADGVHEGGEGRASFVGTNESPLRPAPDPIVQTIHSLCFVPDHLKIRPVEFVGGKAWHLLPDEVTVLIPDIEDSMRLLAA